jgi:MoaA/NifB/PqqE/SkfB family radical SAM enzyme
MQVMSYIRQRVHESRLLHNVALELTYKCNLDCFFCYNDREKTGRQLSLEQYRLLLTDLARMQTMYLMLTGGEPMVHPHFFEIGSIARDLGFVVRVRTNGHSLSRRIAERVRVEVDPYEVEVSLHGATAEVHDRQTRVSGSLVRLVKNIRNAKSAGLRVGVVSTPTAWNQHQIKEMFVLCDSLDVPLRFQGPVAPRDNGDTTPLAIQPSEQAWEHIVALQKQRYKDTLDTCSERPDEISQYIDNYLKSSNLEPASCGVGVDGVDIDPYGNVQACMHLQENAGSLHEQTIEEIWSHSPLFTRARVRAIESAKQFADIPVKQLGAPIFCLAVEENLNKGCANSCTSGCGRHSSSEVTA